MPTVAASVRLGGDIGDLWMFHRDTRNAALIMPPGGRVLRVEGTFPLVEGGEVLLSARQLPLPFAMTWRIVIAELVEPTLVVDVAIQSPFRAWRHEHRLSDEGGGVVTLTDHIDFELGFGPLGRLAAPVARRQLKRGFLAPRHAAMRGLFPLPAGAAPAEGPGSAPRA